MRDKKIAQWAVRVGAGLRRNSGFVDDGRTGVLVEIFLRNAIERERRNRTVELTKIMYVTRYCMCIILRMCLE